MKWSLFALLIGFGIDLIVGDPHGLPHPVVGIGKLISLLERRFRALFPKTARGEIFAGACIWLCTVLVSAGLPALILYGAQRVSVYLRLALESVMCWQVLAVRSLREESMRVYAALQTGSLSAAQQAVSMIVGRDTARLDAAGVTRAAVETVAENTSDGVIAPLLYLALGGAPLGFFYKAVNTMDSMLGYVEPPYKNIGLVPAKADDVLNFIRAAVGAVSAGRGRDSGLGREERLAHLPARPVPAREPELRADGVGLRGPARPAPRGRRVVPRRPAQKAVYRRRAPRH